MRGERSPLLPTRPARHTKGNTPHWEHSCEEYTASSEPETTPVPPHDPRLRRALRR